MIDRVSWLHISDFHFVSQGDQFSQEVATRALLDDVDGRIGNDYPTPDFVLVSGDIAFSGKPSEYERAAGFLAELASRVGLPQGRFFFVPGNHDVDRSKHQLAFKGARHSLVSEQDVDRVLGAPEELAPLVDRQAAYRAFVDDFTENQDRSWSAEGLAYVAPVEVGGLRLCIVGLNSAWLSGSDSEEMKLVIGERQIIGALQIANDLRPKLLVAMAHHPIGLLQEWDQLGCQHRLLREAHFYHRGHLHRTEVALTSTPDRPCLSVAAGSAHATRFFPNSYTLVDLDLGNAKCSVSSIRYDSTQGRYAPEPSVGARVVLQGSLPGTAEDLAAALVSNAHAPASMAPYLVALILGDKTEIPVKIGDRVEFRALQVAQSVLDEELLIAQEFLKLPSLLRLYDDDVPLADRVREHANRVEEFARYLSRLADQDVSCSARITSAQEMRAELSGTHHLTHTREYLSGLRREEDWVLLETQARRLIDSPDTALARSAKASLAEALMHSDETAKRREAVEVANELVNSAAASIDDYLLAAGCNEGLGEVALAVSLTTRALKEPGDHSALQSYARALALRSGDSGLRATLDSLAEERRGT